MATFGKLTNGANQTQNTNDRATVSKFTLSEAGSVTKLTIRCWVGTNARNAKGVIYADSGGAPGALQGETNQVSVSNTSEQANDFTFATPVAVTALDWWLGIIWDADAAPDDFYVSHDATVNERQRVNITYPTAPDPFGAPTATQGPLDVYATYTPLVNVAGSQPAASATLARLYHALRAVVSSQPTATGELTATKLVSRLLEGAQLAAIGTLVRLAQYFRALTGNHPASSASLTKRLWPFRPGTRVGKIWGRLRRRP